MIKATLKLIVVAALVLFIADAGITEARKIKRAGRSVVASVGKKMDSAMARYKKLEREANKRLRD